MKFFIFIISILISSCLQNPPSDQDVGARDTRNVDNNDILIKPDRADFVDVWVEEDIKSGPDMITTPPNFPDPNRPGMDFDTCVDHFDCNRISACRGGQCGKRVTGCGWFAMLPISRDAGCLLNEYGTGQQATAECKEDSDCPSNMPNCFLRMCQINARCTVDSECVGEQFCDYDTWCSIRAPCEGENKHCWRGKCEPDGLFCSYPAR